VQAKDADAGENADIKYSIYHVSNNGKNKFAINETTGDFQVVWRVNAGEQYSVTIQVSLLSYRKFGHKGFSGFTV
jgi:protocadherin-15